MTEPTDLQRLLAERLQNPEFAYEYAVTGLRRGIVALMAEQRKARGLTLLELVDRLQMLPPRYRGRLPLWRPWRRRQAARLRVEAAEQLRLFELGSHELSLQQWLRYGRAVGLDMRPALEAFLNALQAQR